MIQKLLIGLVFLSSLLFSSEVLVKVNNQTITTKDANEFLSVIAPNTTYDTLQEDEKDIIKNRLIDKVLFVEVALMEGIDKTKEFNNTMAHIIEQRPEFSKQIDKIKEELVINMWLNTQMDGIIVSASEAKRFYDKNQEKFISKASMHARHILVASKDKANEIIDDLKSLSGSSLKDQFISLAKSESTGPSGVNGGDLGTFFKGQMVPEFSSAVWSLKKGELTKEPVKTKFGYHVIYLEDKFKATTTTFEDVKDKIVSLLTGEQFQNKITDIATELRANAKIIDISEGK